MPALSQRLLKISMWFSQAKEKLGQHQKLLLILSLFLNYITKCTVKTYNNCLVS